MNIELKPWRLEYAPDLAKVMNSPKVQGNLRDGLPMPYTPADGAEFITAMLAADSGKTYSRAVFAEGVLAGSIGIFRQDNIHFRTAELGYCLGEEFWGRGIATQAVRLACRHIFETTDILRIFAEPFAENAASSRVLEKAGFSFEGLLRWNAVKNGELKDMKMYAIIKE